MEASLGIVAASAYTLRPLFRSLLNLSSRVPGYTTSKGGGASGAGYMQNKARRTGENSRGAPSSQQGIPMHPEPVHLASAVASTRSPFGDSNEDVRGPSQDSEQGGIRVQRGFEILRVGKRDAEYMQR